MSAIGAILVLAAFALCAIVFAHRRRFFAERRQQPGAQTRQSFLRMIPSGKERESLRSRQLAMALPLASELLRAGLTPEMAMASVAESLDAPLGPELSRAVSEVTSMGRTLAEALDALAERTRSEDLSLMADAVAVQKEGGGNLADVLDSIGRAIADKAEAQGHLESITSSARFSAAIVAATPPLLLALLSVASPAYMEDFWNSALWPAIVMLAAFLDLAGLACIRRLYRIDLS